MEVPTQVGSKIVGTGSYIPEAILTNQDLARMVDTSDEWITRRTGIKERRIAGAGQFSSDMAAAAAEKALEMAGLAPAELDMIVVGTVTPDRQFPSCACVLQDKIGAPRAAGMDVSAGCSGFIYALSVAHNAIRCGEVKNALVVGAEVLSSILNWSDRRTCVLMGDGAGAVVLTRTEERAGIKSIHLKSDGSLGDLLYAEDECLPRPGNGLLALSAQAKPFYVVMDGNRLFKKAVRCLEEVALTTLERARVAMEEVSLLIPHQANMRIIKALGERLGLAEDKVLTTIHKHGNTSSASIPIAIDEACRAGRLSTADKILLVTFGAGLTWGSALLEWGL